MRFYCFDDRGVQYEVPQEDILYYLENNDCMPKNPPPNSTIDEYDTLLTRTVIASSSVSLQNIRQRSAMTYLIKNFKDFQNHLQMQ